MLEASARNHPDKAMLRYQGRSIGYAEFSDLSRRAATVLHAHGVRAGGRVALMCLNTPGFLAAMFGALRLGAVVVPVNHKLQAPEVEYIVGHAGIRACVHDASLAPVLARVPGDFARLATGGECAGTPSFDTLASVAEPWPAAPAQGDARDENVLAEILYTSGTTGKPKGCLHSHRNVFAAALATAAGMAIGHDERMLIAMPIWHASPLNNWTMATLLMGGTVVLLREYQPAAFLQIIEDEAVTATFCAPIALLAPLHAVPDFRRYRLGSMRKWIYGGGPIGAEQARLLIEAYGSPNFIQVYGMSETGPLGTALYAGDALDRAGSIGRIGMPGVQLRVRSADGSPTLPGQVGEIQMRSVALMQGYLDDPAASRAALGADGWYGTGDLARLDDAGFLYIVDRSKDVIITGGENVYSKEVEDALAAHPLVQDVAVVGRPHPEWGETVAACIVPKPGQDPAMLADEDFRALRDFLAPRLARYKIPRLFEIHATLPRTPSGKLMKHVLRAGQAAGPSP